jgi:ubiquinone/menaquinone biosynthesis C-methylase UbiE
LASASALQSGGPPFIRHGRAYAEANRDGVDGLHCEDDDMDETTASATAARYDEVADFYAAGFPDRYDDSATEALLELVGAVDGLDVLDLACGHGRITRELARRDGRVFGVDIAGRFITLEQDALPANRTHRSVLQ